MMSSLTVRMLQTRVRFKTVLYVRRGDATASSIASGNQKGSTFRRRTVASVTRYHTRMVDTALFNATSLRWLRLNLRYMSRIRR